MNSLDNTSNYINWYSSDIPVTSKIDSWSASIGCNAFVRTLQDKYLYLTVPEPHITNFFTNLSKDEFFITNLDEYLDYFKRVFGLNITYTIEEYGGKSWVNENRYTGSWYIFELKLSDFINSHHRYYAFCVIRHLYYYTTRFIDSLRKVLPEDPLSTVVTKLSRNIDAHTLCAVKYTLNPHNPVVKQLTPTVLFTDFLKHKNNLSIFSLILNGAIETSISDKGNIDSLLKRAYELSEEHNIKYKEYKFQPRVECIIDCPDNIDEVIKENPKIIDISEFYEISSDTRVLLVYQGVPLRSSLGRYVGMKSPWAGIILTKVLLRGDTMRPRNGTDFIKFISGNIHKPKLSIIYNNTVQLTVDLGLSSKYSNIGLVLGNRHNYNPPNTYLINYVDKRAQLNYGHKLNIFNSLFNAEYVNSKRLVNITEEDCNKILIVRHYESNKKLTIINSYARLEQFKRRISNIDNYYVRPYFAGQEYRLIILGDDVWRTIYPLTKTNPDPSKFTVRSNDAVYKRNKALMDSYVSNKIRDLTTIMNNRNINLFYFDYKISLNGLMIPIDIDINIDYEQLIDVTGGLFLNSIKDYLKHKKICAD